MSDQDLLAPRIGMAANIVSRNAHRASGAKISQGVTAALFGVAIVTYIIRTYIRIRVMQRFLADDYLLLFAVIFLIAATGLAFAAIGQQYDILTILLHGAEPDLIFGVLNEIPTTSKEENAASTLWWLVIIPVKLAFAVFFRRLVTRVRDLRLLCNFVIVFTILAGLVCVAVSWLTCPYFTTEGMICKFLLGTNAGSCCTDSFTSVFYSRHYLQGASGYWYYNLTGHSERRIAGLDSDYHASKNPYKGPAEVWCGYFIMPFADHGNCSSDKNGSHQA